MTKKKKLRGAALIQSINDRFVEIGSSISVTVYVHGVATLSTGVVLDRLGFIRLRNRLKSDQIEGLVDDLYSAIATTRTQAEAELKRRVASLGGKALMASPEGAKTIARATKNVMTARETYGVGFDKGSTPWNKGFNKDNHPVYAEMSEDRSGEGNPMFGVAQSPDRKRRASEHMKKIIADGLFTPNRLNSLTRKSLSFNGRKYRSSWELIFAIKNISLEYEVLRIPYMLNGSSHTYITDFYDRTNRIVYEIKPRSMMKKAKNKPKVDALRNWCAANNHALIIIDDPIISSYLSEVDLDDVAFNELSKNCKIMLRKLYATFEQNRDF